MPGHIKPIIRTATPDDAPEIARLNRQFNGADEPAENYARRLSDPRRVDTPILAELDGRIIGIANLRLLQAVFYSEPYAELTELFVEESSRRLGVGTALVGFAEQIARQSGAKQVLILTDFYNHSAQQLYRSLGYVHYDLALAKNLK
jgi:GNAT superfamily N-acetyltransferase